MDFSKQEKEILNFWDQNEIFKKSLELSRDKESYVFYDGPPFATGLPHYGHILASTIKDIIPRYKTQNGYFVERRWGTDCHGLPIEYEIEKILNIKTKEEVLKLGIDKYNQECRNIVFRYKKEWENTIGRLGRWVDFKNDYKTLDKNFMESVWNVFSKLYKKNLIYKGSKIMPYSTGCTTPLSNFEANSNYKKILDSSLVVKFKIKNPYIISDKIDDTENIFLLVWTTTPWTLPTNLALCINEGLEYILINSEGENYILNTEALTRYFKKKKYQIIRKMENSVMKQIEYIPLFNYYNYENSFKIYSDEYVSSSSGTGIVHLSPAFGEDDNRICKKYNIISNKILPPCPLDENGNFTSEISDYEGIYIKNADKKIVDDLKIKNLVFKFSKELHDYPFCCRSDTALIYKSISCWFVEVTKLKEDIIKNNSTINWSPEWVGSNRFGNWLENLSDWCISRNRYWGTPIPIWTSNDGEEIVVIESVEELEKMANVDKGSIKDLHRDIIDHITIPSKKGKGTLHRIEEVLDCWFESGSMPFAQNHYPFSVSEKDFVDKYFPADFIAEGLDQTRGWFYTLLVLSTALFNKSPFKNVIVNGLVLAEDGQKMSKRKKNYTPPEDIIDKYGADAVRLSLINSPVVKAEEMFFRDKDVENILKDIHIPLKNSLSFLKQMIDLYEKKNNKFKPFLLDNITDKYDICLIDKWLIQTTNKFIIDIHKEVNNYRLHKIVNISKNYLDIISKWYININKNRIKNAIYNDQSQNSLIPLSLIVNCLYYYCLMTAPFSPFLSEIIFQEIKELLDIKELSIHLIQMPDKICDNEENIINNMNLAINIINLGRRIRTKEDISFKKPVKEIVIISPEIEMISQEITDIIHEELNVLNITKNNENKFIKYLLLPNYKKAGKKLGKEINKFKKFLENMQSNEIQDFFQNEYVLFEDQKIEKDLIEIKTEFYNIDTKYNYDSDKNILLLMDRHTDDNIQSIYNSKLLVREIQKMRKEFEFEQHEEIKFYYKIMKEGKISEILKNKQKQYIYPILKSYISEMKFQKYNQSKLLSINDNEIKIYLSK
jgi:isoleucyl-tRNA synthetase